MGWLDALRGRRPPPPPRLDALFAIPAAAVTMEVAGWRPTGTGGVCYRAADGGAFADLQSEIRQLLDADDGPPVEFTRDEYGFTWLTVRGAPSVGDLVTDLHAVNTSLEAQGFSAGLLCSTVGFERADGRRLGLVYLYKQGTFYPFAPTGGTGRDNLVELQVRDLVIQEIPVEGDLQRWLGLYGCPAL